MKDQKQIDNDISIDIICSQLQQKLQDVASGEKEKITSIKQYGGAMLIKFGKRCYKLDLQLYDLNTVTYD